MRQTTSTNRETATPGRAHEDRSKTGDRPQAIVVGSGFGGAVASCRLSAAGFEVLLIERGRRYEAGDFPAMPAESAFLPDLRRWSWKHNQGLWDVVDLEELISLQAAGYGGGSLVYANVHLRPPPQVFDDKWPAVYRDGKVLQPYFDLAAYMLEVSPAFAHHAYLGKVIKADQLKQAAQALGRKDGFFHPPLAISYTTRTNRHGVEQRACTQCGRCSTGCPERAKHTLDYNYLSLAERQGARVLTQHEVLDVEDSDSGWVVKCYDHLTARAERYEAPYLFLCAGSLHSTRLLARARLKRHNRCVQHRVGIGYSPGGDALGVVYDTDHPQRPSRGPTIATTLVHWNSDRPGSFFMIQDGGYGQELERLLGVLKAPAWLGRNRLTRVRAPRAPKLKPTPEGAPGSPVNGASFVLASLVDEVFDAWSTNAFSSAVPPPLRQAFAEWLNEFERPLLLSAVVEQTIDRAARAFYARCWLTKRCKSEGFPITWLIAAQKWLARHFFGDGRKIAEHALRAIVDSGGLEKREIARRVLGYDDANADHRAMLLVMGRDAARGHLHYDRKSNKLWADLDLYHLAPGYTRGEQLMTDIADQLGGELRTSPAWAFLGKPVTVHNQGGCPMSDAPEDGVTDSDGQVHGCKGLYVLDGAALPSSVGVNPSASILALAERNIETFLRKHVADWNEQSSNEAARDYYRQRAEASAWVRSQPGWHFSPPGPPNPDLESTPLGLRFSEWMQGYYSPHAGARPEPWEDAVYRAGETRGRPGATAGDPGFAIELALNNSVRDLNVFYEDMNHELQIQGTVKVRLPSQPSLTETAFPIQGYLRLFVPRRKPYGIDPRTQPGRLKAQTKLAGPYRTTIDRYPPARHRNRFLRYELTFEANDEFWLLRGKKRIRDDPGFDAWRDTSSLFVRLFGPYASRPDITDPCAYQNLAGYGVVHVDFNTFLYRQLHSFAICPDPDDPARTSWAITKFATFFFGELQRIYAPEILETLDTFLRLRPSNVRTGNAR